MKRYFYINHIEYHSLYINFALCIFDQCYELLYIILYIYTYVLRINNSILILSFHIFNIFKNNL